MRAAGGIAITFLLCCGTTTSHDPQITDPCSGQCASDQICNSQTGGVKDAGTFSTCASWPTACDGHHDCACLIAALGQCPVTECGVGPTGTYVYHCTGS